MKKRENFLVFGSPVIEEDEIAAVCDTLRSKWIGTGPKVSEFEKRFREYIGIEYSAALNSCTAGLHLALVALDLPAGSEVITTPMTFCATANAIIHSGCVPVFCDVDPVSRNLTAEKIKEKITPRTKAIVPVHFAGYPCDMVEIMKIAKENNLYVVEDCAHAIESTINGKHVGTFGDIGCFSFYVTKNLMTGEGGMIVTKNPKLEAKIKVLALHGMSKDAWKRFGDEGYKHYQVIYPGFKYNMMDIQAALGLIQLGKVERFRSKRVELWKIFKNEFKNLSCRLPSDHDGHAYHLFCLEVDSEKMKGKTRDQVLLEYQKLNIGVGVHYQALHLQPFYESKYGYSKGMFPNAENIGTNTISIPFSPALTDKDIEDVILATKEIFQ